MPLQRALTAIDALIRQAERDRLWHKQRGKAGYIEAAAVSIRIRALKDAKEAIDESSSG